MHTKKKGPAEPGPPPKNPLLLKLRERKILETIAAFIGGGWLILEFVHWILVDHYRWPERWIDFTFITLLGALLVSLTWRWFRAPGAKKRKVKSEFILIPLFLVFTLVLDIRVLQSLKEGHGGAHGQGAHAEDAAPQESHAITANSIAVIPFRNLSPENERGYLHEGMTDALIAKLSGLRDLRVTSWTSVMRYQESESDIQTIGRELHVASVLEGSVQREQDKIRISVRLFSTEDGFQVWGETYERTMDSLFVVQDEIAQSVTEALKLTLAPEQMSQISKHATENLEAYNLYIQGRGLWNRRTRNALEQAIEFFKQTIDRDPSYSLAYSGIADSLIALANISALPPDEAYPEAREWARQALQMDNSLAEAHASIAVTKFFYEWDWEGAERKFKKSLEVNPSYAFARQTYALFLAAMSRSDEARAAIEEAAALDPSSDTIAAAAGVIAYMARDNRRAAARLEALAAASPEFPLAHFYLGWLDMEQGRYSAAVQRFRRALSLAGGDPRMRACLGCALWKSGNMEGARAVHGELEELSPTRYIDPAFIALLHMDMGETDQALDWLEKGYAEHSYWMTWLNVDPAFDPLRKEPRFRELLSRLKFPE